MRIVSFLPSATEMIYALGLGEHLVGITHECDYPESVRTKPVVVRSIIETTNETKNLRPQEIDEAVSRALKAGQSLYVVDETLLRELRPDLILTQDLCQVCAPSGNEVGRVIGFLSHPPEIVWLAPKSLGEIFDNLKQIGEATGKEETAARVVQSLDDRVRRVREKIQSVKIHPRVFCMEWLSPPYNAGHWMPELVEWAGGLDGLGRKGEDSTRMTWEQILDYAPEVLILSPCGFHLDGVLRQAHLLKRYPDWERLPAVRQGRVYAVDADSYFARPGPRVVDGLELLSTLIHREQFRWEGPDDAYRRLAPEDFAEMEH